MREEGSAGHSRQDHAVHARTFCTAGLRACFILLTCIRRSTAGVSYTTRLGFPVECSASAVPCAAYTSGSGSFTSSHLVSLPVNLRGKVVLVDFWATWCQPCKKEMPGYQKLLNLYGSREFTVIGFKFDTMMDTEDPFQFAKKIVVRYPLAVAPDDLKQKFGGIEGLPTTMLYDRQGMLRKKVLGFEYTGVIESEVKPLF